MVEQLPAGTVVDGELVVYRHGRCDFTALQQRIRSRPALAVPATLAVFDVLALAGWDLRGLPYRKRRKQLRGLLAEVTLPLALMPATRELAGAQAWMHNHIAAGVEGVVIKHREHGYRPRRRLVEGPHTHERGRRGGRCIRAPERPGSLAARPARQSWPLACGGPHKPVDVARAARGRCAAGAPTAGASLAGTDPVVAVRAAAG